MKLGETVNYSSLEVVSLYGHIPVSSECAQCLKRESWSHTFSQGALEAVNLVGGAAGVRGAWTSCRCELRLLLSSVANITLLGVGSGPTLLEQKPCASGSFWLFTISECSTPPNTGTIGAREAILEQERPEHTQGMGQGMGCYGPSTRVSDYSWLSASLGSSKAAHAPFVCCSETKLALSLTTVHSPQCDTPHPTVELHPRVRGDGACVWLRLVYMPWQSQESDQGPGKFKSAPSTLFWE